MITLAPAMKKMLIYGKWHAKSLSVSEQAEGQLSFGPSASQTKLSLVSLVAVGGTTNGQISDEGGGWRTKVEINWWCFIRLTKKRWRG